MPNERHPADQTFPTVAIIIPALNEAESLPLVLRDLPSVGRVIVVDNGSTDNTASIASDQGATVVHEAQRGYGAACLKGLAELDRLIQQDSVSIEIVAFVDADYSDHVHLLGTLFHPIQSNEADFVLGSRLLGEREPGAMPPQSVYGNKLACGLMNLFFGSRYTDLGPMRAVGYDSLKRLGMVDQNFGWTIESRLAKLNACVFCHQVES